MRGATPLVACAVAGGALLVGSAFASSTPDRSRTDRLEDFDAKTTDWPAVCAADRDAAGEARDPAAFVGVVERRSPRSPRSIHGPSTRPRATGR